MSSSNPFVYCGQRRPLLQTWPSPLFNQPQPMLARPVIIPNQHGLMLNHHHMPLLPSPQCARTTMETQLVEKHIIELEQKLKEEQEQNCKFSNDLMIAVKEKNEALNKVAILEETNGELRDRVKKYREEENKNLNIWATYLENKNVELKSRLNAPQSFEENVAVMTAMNIQKWLSDIEEQVKVQLKSECESKSQGFETEIKMLKQHNELSRKKRNETEVKYDGLKRKYRMLQSDHDTCAKKIENNELIRLNLERKLDVEKQKFSGLSTTVRKCSEGYSKKFVIQTGALTIVQNKLKDVESKFEGFKLRFDTNSSLAAQKISLMRKMFENGAKSHVAELSEQQKKLSALKRRNFKLKVLNRKFISMKKDGIQKLKTEERKLGRLHIKYRSCRNELKKMEQRRHSEICKFQLEIEQKKKVMDTSEVGNGKIKQMISRIAGVFKLRDRSYKLSKIHTDCIDSNLPHVIKQNLLIIIQGVHEFVSDSEIREKDESSRNSVLEIELARIKKELSDQEEKLDKVNEKCVSYEQQLMESKEQIVQLKQKLQTEKEIVDRTLSRLQLNIKHIHTELVKIESSNDIKIDLSTDLESAVGQVDSLMNMYNDRMVQLARNNDKLQEELKQKDKFVSDIEIRQKEEVNSNSLLKLELAGIKVEFSDQRKKLDEVNRKFLSSEQQVMESKEHIIQLRQKLHTEKEIVDRAVSRVQLHINRIHTELVIESSNDIKIENSTDLESAVGQVDSLMNMYNDRMVQLARNNDKLQEELKQKNEKLEKCLKEYTAKVRMFYDKEEQLQRMQQTIANLESRR